jgi:hypothetical protein
MKISDGKGSGQEAQVSLNRLLTQAAASTELHENSITDAQVYMFSTGAFISLTTTGTETGILYIKNTSTTKNLFIHEIRTCGDVAQKVTFYKNPTGGTLVTDETAGQSTNLNFTSSNSADATIYKGADAKTVTGGTWLGQHINHIGHSNNQTGDALVLGRNDSLAITFEVASAGDVCVAIVGYFE